MEYWRATSTMVNISTRYGIIEAGCSVFIKRGDIMGGDIAICIRKSDRA